MTEDLQKENDDLKEQIRQLKNELASLRNIERELLQAVNDEN